ncbi:hypothetical protein GUJ93_ZPchr0011g27367 [Zizania palustris]|uniref:DUF4378 domain-containing protein n=1 Tax=Zizania palustris TaxID=103762 RepID=A0A8J5WJH6_ZIZPA|nr:hypothetical protein GUJ93_ZPchr0011g27367 [Zizania palustris]
MASLSPSPSGRRLSELLEEKQEPFFLDLHLLEKGCSSRLVDGYDSTAMCWPAGGNDAASVLKRLAASNKKEEEARGSRGKKKQAAPAATGLLRILLSKILHGKAANRRKPAALQFSESFKQIAPSPCSAKHLDDVEVAACAADEEIGYIDSDSDDEKQFSPVSVLEHPFESSPVHSQSKCSVTQGSPKHAMAFVRGLLEAAYSPALLSQLLSKTDDLIKGATAWSTDDADDYYYRTSPKNVLHDDDEAAASSAAASAYWEAHRAELTMVSKLVAAEIPNSSRLDAADVRPERQDVGAELEAAVLEHLLQELAVDLAGCC